MNATSSTALRDLVERLRAETGQFVPYVGRGHGGVNAPILSVLRDPGKATNLTGALSTDNPDPTSKRQRELVADAGLSATDLCPWNAYPWAHDPAVDGALNVEHVARGAVVLREVIDLMKDLRVLLLQGEQARWAWAMVRAFAPEVCEHGFEVVVTCHPLGTRGKTTAVTAANKSNQLGDWIRAAGFARCRSPATQL